MAKLYNAPKASYNRRRRQGWTAIGRLSGSATGQTQENQAHITPKSKIKEEKTMAYTCYHCNLSFEKAGQLARHYRGHKARGLPSREEEAAKLLREGKSVSEVRSMGFSRWSITVGRKLLADAPPSGGEFAQVRGIIDRIGALKDQVTRLHAQAEEVLAFLSGIGAEEEKIKALEAELAQVKKVAESKAKRILKASAGAPEQQKVRRASKVT